MPSRGFRFVRAMVGGRIERIDPPRPPEPTPGTGRANVARPARQARVTSRRRPQHQLVSGCKASQVLGPMMPSTVSPPQLDWNFRTASRVKLPK